MLELPAVDTRTAALRVAGRVYARQSGDPAVEPIVGDAVIAALNDKNADVKTAAMQALGSMKNDRAAQGLTDLFQYYKKGNLAQVALGALAQVGSPASVPVFATQLSASMPFRVLAIEGIARAGDASKAKDIDAALEGGRSDTLNLAGWFASARLSKGPIDQIVEALARPALHDQAFGYLVELAPGRVRDLMQGAQDPDPRLRADLADALGLSGDPAAMPALASMPKDADPKAALAVARASRRLNSSR
jgi:HEAT repeat protein